MSRSLLFIPDISGFTRFVHQTEVQHSRHIISELFEQLIDANTLGLELVELEGDALFYFKPDLIPSAEELFTQAEKMYKAFHYYLKSYEERRICPCGACETAINLELKFVAHCGELDFIEVKDIRKPYGEATIQVHRILKNSVALNEYLLISSRLWQDLNGEQVKTELNWSSGTDRFDFGEFSYCYAALEPWKKQIKTVSPVEYHRQEKPDFVLSKSIPVAPQALFELISNLEYRLRWVNGIKELKYKKNQVNRSGASHVCVLSNGTINVQSFTERRGDNVLVLGEMTTDPPIADTIASLFIVAPEKNGTASTLSIEVRLEGKGLVYTFLKPFLLMKLKASLNRNLNNIADQAEELVETLPITQVYP